MAIQEILGEVKIGNCFLVNMIAAPLAQEVVGEPVHPCAGLCGVRRKNRQEGRSCGHANKRSGAACCCINLKAWASPCSARARTHDMVCRALLRRACRARCAPHCLRSPMAFGSEAGDTNHCAPVGPGTSTASSIAFRSSG